MNLYMRMLDGPTDWGWIQQQTDIMQCGDTVGIVVIDLDTNTTVAATVFDSFTKNSCKSHFMATETSVFADKLIMETCTGYIFNVRGMKTVYGYVRSDNTKSLRRAPFIGFTELTRLKDAYDDGVDAVILELTRSSCAFLPAETETEIEEVA